jgi:hypothetical protein
MLISSAWGISLCTVGTVLAQSNAIALAFISASCSSSIAASAADTVDQAPASTPGSAQNFGAIWAVRSPPAIAVCRATRRRFLASLALECRAVCFFRLAYLLLVRKPIQADHLEMK